MEVPVLAVALTAERPSPQSARRLEHEYALASDLDSAWAARPLALTRYGGCALLVLKDPGGEPLDLLIAREQGQMFELARFLRLAIGLAAALGQVHRQGLIHKDIKPSHALVDESGRAWFTGFGIASKLRHEHHAPAPPEVIAGTLAYMAPEQTGRMNRSLDLRGDLYSLGVTLYQALTGELPFTATDPLEWIHCHIARKPRAPADLGPILEPLSAIIMKLLAKNSEERYQTAVGLETDLRQCLSQWLAQGRIDSFALGTEDTPERLQVPEKLYGRSREVDALLTAFDWVVSHGSAKLVLVSGYSGVGKSSVVQELHKVLVPPRGLFASGKFDQYQRDVPYATLALALRMLARQILVKSEAEVSQWSRVILAALGSNGQLMIDLIPDLEFVIGRQPPVPELPPRESRNRFHLVFKRLLGVFATPEHPLALFLDDLQWLDMATLELLEHLVTDPEVRHVLLIGAYRDNEVDSVHPLMRTLASIREGGITPLEIVLSPLTHHDIGLLVGESLRVEINSADHLAQLIHEKTAGNPFFAKQFLMSLAEEELIRFDPAMRRWVWDLKRIRDKAYTTNVVDLMVAKLERLPHRTQSALQRVACLGNTAEGRTLQVAFGYSAAQLHADLLEAIAAGLLRRHEESYVLLHDRIQEAAYALIPESARAATHLEIGRTLLRSLSPEELTAHLFEVANQFQRAQGLPMEITEQLQVADLNLRAGRKSKAASAHSSARGYFAAGRALLEKEDWSRHYELQFSLGLEYAEAELLCGNSDKSAELIEELLLRAASRTDATSVYRLKIQLHIMTSNDTEAIAAALRCLRDFGLDLPMQPTEEQVGAEFETLWPTLGGRTIESLLDMPPITDPDLKALMRVMSTMTGPAYFTNPRLWFLHILRMVKLCMQHGASSACIMAYSSIAVVLCGRYHRYAEGFLFGRLSCDIADKHGFVEHKTNAYIALAQCAFWTQPIGMVVESVRKGFDTAIEADDQYFACTSLYHEVMYRLLRNDPLDVVWRETEAARELTSRSRFVDLAAIVAVQRRLIAELQGDAAKLSDSGVDPLDEATLSGRMPLLASWYWMYKLKTRFLMGDHEMARIAGENSKQLLGITVGMPDIVHYYYYGALTVAALYADGSPAQQETWRNEIEQLGKQLEEWAENCPSTFADKHLLVRAEIARLDGRSTDALGLYEQAIQSARQHGFVQNEGLANELAGRYCLRLGLETAGHAHLANARNCYERWGAHGKVKQIVARYSRYRDVRLPGAMGPIASPVAQLDVETALKASRAISSEIELPTLIEKLMHISIEHAGANRGVLILFRGDAPQIEAEAMVVEGQVAVTARQADITEADLPLSMVHYLMRSFEAVLLDDALSDTVHSQDQYVQRNRLRSVLLLPILKQAQPVGALYLENTLTPGVFTHERLTILQLLASQAAISIENARLYTELKRSEAFMAQGQLISQTGSFGWSVATGRIHWSEEIYKLFEYDSQIQGTFELGFERTHPADRELVRETLGRAIQERTDFDFKYRLLMPDGRVKYAHVIGRPMDSGELDFVGAVRDITESTRAEEELRRAQDHLTRINRLTTIGELTASLGHELSQPISGAMASADTCRMLLEKPVPELESARAALSRVVRDTQRAVSIIERLRSKFRKDEPDRELLDVNEIGLETIALLRDEALRHEVSIRTQLAAVRLYVLGDRVQLQQVLMNLLVNGIDALKDSHGHREIVLKSEDTEQHWIHISISDTGIGFPPHLAQEIFTPFFTTKPHGTGLGLRICKSIVEDHGGQLWGVGNPGHGATFHLNLPSASQTWTTPST
ncbi:MAG TPA: AAA family ATPase [Steroidobacteraceae bacterium]|nr:AAA family ATPase [Steroidobacteraceae bacterium]